MYVVAERVVLVRFQIQLLRLPCRLGQCFGRSFSLTSCSGGPLAFQFPGGKHLARFILECAKAFAERCGGLRQKSQSCVGVHAELSKAMPMRQIKQKPANGCIVGLW